ncbi:hypothetical protein REPUB_Repub01dG0031200 [Reevesia pubescens]
MKLDSEQVLCHSTIGHKSDSKPYSFLADTKPFENKEKPLDSIGLNAEGFVKDGQDGVIHDIKGNDGNSDPSLYLEKTRDGWPASKLDSSMSVNEFANGNEKEVRDFVTSNSLSSQNMDSFQESVFYLDKSVMECELPELVVCYKESTYHVVKDICIDEGVPTQDKFLFDSGVDEKSNCNFLSSEKDQDSKMMKEKLEIDLSMQDITVSPEENQSGKDIDNECGSNKKLDDDTCMQDVSLSLEENESNKGIPEDDAMKMITNDVSKELLTLGLLSMPELSTVKSEPMSSDGKSDGIEQQSFQNSSEKEVVVTPPLVSAVEESNNSSEEAILSAPALVFAAEESDSENWEATISHVQASASEKSTSSSLVNEVSDDSKQQPCPLVSAVEESNNSSEEAILSAPASVSAAEESDSGNGEATISPIQAFASEESTCSSLVNEVSDDSKQENGSITFDFDSSAPTSSKEESRQPLETGSIPKLEDIADQPFSNNLQCGNGETSFSAAGPVTGLISYSGPIAYSGSLSLRSDSSTTSTRSFAFPILQSDWNSSPVRMAKADRRHYRKHRGWRQGLLCCRF